MTEPLRKAGFNRLKEMFQGTDEHDAKVRWVADSIKHEPLQVWFLRNVKKDPSIFHQDNLDAVKHMDGMTQVAKEMKDVKLDKKDDFSQGMRKMKAAESQWQGSSGNRFVKPEGKKIIDFGNGMGWYDLGKPESEEEGRALGHCGNRGDPHPNDRILSLRQEKQLGNKTVHEPHLTFVENKGWIGEMKGRANSKPGEKYHPLIAELLKNRRIKGMIGAGYLPEANFHFDDMSPGLQQQVRHSNPKMIDLRSGQWAPEERESAAKSAPKVRKYMATVADMTKAREAKQKLDAGQPASKLSTNEVRLILNDHRVGPEEHARVVKNLHKFGPRKMSDAALKLAADSRTDKNHIIHMLHMADTDHVGGVAQIFQRHPAVDGDVVNKVIETAGHEIKGLGYFDHPAFGPEHFEKWARGQHLSSEDLDHPKIDSPTFKRAVLAASYVRGLTDHPLMDQDLAEQLTAKDGFRGLEMIGTKFHSPSVQQKAVDYLSQPEARANVEHARKVISHSSDAQVHSIASGNPYATLRLAVEPNMRPASLTDQHVRTAMDAAGSAALSNVYHSRHRNDMNGDHLEVYMSGPNSRLSMMENGKYSNITQHPAFDQRHADLIAKNAHIAKEIVNTEGNLHPSAANAIVQHYPKIATADVGSNPERYSKEVRSLLVRKHPEEFLGSPTRRVMPQHLNSDDWNFLASHPLQSKLTASMYESSAKQAKEIEDRNNEAPIVQKSMRLNKSETSRGLTQYDLGDGYSLSHSDHLYNDDGSIWRSADPAVHSWVIEKDGHHVGAVGLHSDKGQMAVNHAQLLDSHRGKGLGRRAYSKLSKHYGSLASGVVRSPDADRAWGALGAKKERVGHDSQYRLDAPEDTSVRWTLEKAVQRNNVWVPEEHDIGKPHPEHPDRIGHRMRNGLLSYASTPEQSKKRDDDTVRSAHSFINGTLKGQFQEQRLTAKLLGKVLADPDRHAIAGSSEDDRAPSLRLRHLYAALNGKPGYQIKASPDGVRVQATRHSNNPLNQGRVDSWHFDGTTLKPDSGTTD